MTRETKIGLLVGLAFIIVVAILLTDHTSSVKSPQAAALTDAAPNVRDSVNTPAAPIPTRADLANSSRPRTENARPPVVEVGPGGNGPIALVGRETAQPDGGRPDGGIGLPPLVATNRGGRAPTPQDLVDQHPQDLVAIGDRPAPPANGRRPTTLPVTPPKTYTAEAGDSVSRIAQKTMGGNTKANRDALIKANPSLQSEGNIVHAGKAYIIPSPGATQQAGEAPRTPAVQPFTPAPAGNAALAFNWYIVKENDTLWRIAARELGDSRQWTTIRDINKDVLKGGEIVHPQMRIRLPKQATASTN